MRGRAPWWKRDVRRQWECPACGRRAKTGGHVVNCRCDCGQAWMRLLEDAPRPKKPKE